MCIFCKIINKEIPGKIVYETKETIAFLDLSQATKGHTLVLPKRHFNNMLETDMAVWTELASTVKTLSNAIYKAFNPKGINILNNTLEGAGQTVMHTHIHIIPRYENDGINIDLKNNEGLYNLDEIKDNIIKNIG